MTPRSYDATIQPQEVFVCLWINIDDAYLACVTSSLDMAKSYAGQAAQRPSFTEPSVKWEHPLTLEQTSMDGIHYGRLVLMGRTPYGPDYYIFRCEVIEPDPYNPP